MYLFILNDNVFILRKIKIYTIIIKMYILLYYFMDLQNIKEVNYTNILKINKQLKKLKVNK